jgi:hypothetical protein
MARDLSSTLTSDAVRVAEKAAEGNALAGRLVKQNGKLNFVVIVASGGHLKEVMLEPPKVGARRLPAHNPLRNMK